MPACFLNPVQQQTPPHFLPFVKVVMLLLLLVRVVRVLGHSLPAGCMLQLLLGRSHPP